MYQYTDFDRQFIRQRAAQYRDQLDANPADPHGLDSDRDGMPCEDLPRGALPRTGASNRTTTGVGTFLLGAGLVLVGTARLRRRSA